MSYRSIKRVLGETSLERKCRLLFGACLLVLITGTFWWVENIAGKLVMTSTQNQASDLVGVILIKLHSVYFETRPSLENPDKKEAREWLRELIADFEESQDYTYDVVSLSPNYWIREIKAKPPQDEVEWELMRQLERKQIKREEVLAEAAAEAQRGVSGPFGSDGVLDRVDDLPPVFVDRVLPNEKGGEYHYFKPVVFEETCWYCHKSAVDVGSLSAADIGDSLAAEPPMMAMKVVLPYEETRKAINKSRAILIAVAILTVFVAMVTLYLIVRYVIVKPLKHLRDVSDDVSRGKMEVRAEINTNDEFEDLAQSFNRMLRHLTDAQAELRRVNSDLDVKVDELAQLNMRLYEMNRLKDDFLANMSHELRTPLNSIIGFSEVLHGINSLTDKQKRYAGNIQKSGRLLLEMINDILDLAKMEAGKMEVRPTEFRIETVVQAQCDMVRSLAEDKKH